MIASKPISRTSPAAVETAKVSRPPRTQLPQFRLSDLWKAPLHDLPMRDEILYQFLPLSPEMEVLEFGPGSGFTAFRVARMVRSLTLVDVAQSNVDHLSSRLGSVPNLDFVCADACAPNLAHSLRKRFDAIYGLEVFEYMPDPGACLRNLAEVLKPGGTLLMEFPNYPPPKSPGVTFFRTRRELDCLLEAAGFERWNIYALKLRPWARAIYRQVHERPRRLLHWLRNSRAEGRPQTYDGSWAFRSRSRLEAYRVLMHGAWSATFAVLRLGGHCFERTLLGSDIWNRDLLVVARR